MKADMSENGENSNLEELQRKVAIIRETNAKLAREIESMGGGVELGVARQEHLIGKLVSLGILSMEDAWEEQLDWEQSLKPQLISVRDRILEMIQEQRNQQAGRPTVPPKKQLWTPGT